MSIIVMAYREEGAFGLLMTGRVAFWRMLLSRSLPPSSAPKTLIYGTDNLCTALFVQWS